MPRKVSTAVGAPTQRPLSRAEAARSVEAVLEWDVGTPEEERCDGFKAGTLTALYLMNDRAELLRVLDALDRGKIEFLMEIQKAEFIASTPAGRVKLELLEAYLFGPTNGGANGPYGRAYFAALKAAGPFVNSLH